MLRSARGEYVAQNACITGSPLLISLVFAEILVHGGVNSSWWLLLHIYEKLGVVVYPVHLSHDEEYSYRDGARSLFL